MSEFWLNSSVGIIPSGDRVSFDMEKLRIDLWLKDNDDPFKKINLFMGIDISKPTYIRWLGEEGRLYLLYNKNSGGEIQESGRFRPEGHLNSMYARYIVKYESSSMILDRDEVCEKRPKRPKSL